eukprot:TRINITY_DN5304_c1_g1_i1.p1 TRINITY_DN5304_c1_g1~~TRINITY_DN5304_c1_g1_i1.p1  ORF type:complete len:255 (-),score=51.76 TRINITY_DN5304_c1_g1_i1:463-1227(-)
MEGDSGDRRREGFGLLGDCTFEDIGNGKLRCVETGHELLSKDADTYRNSKGCRLALIDRAVGAKKPPLNFFDQSPLSKSKLICRLTGDSINKTEEHIWKHLNGKKFLNKLSQKEAERAGTAKRDKKQGNARKVQKNSKRAKVWKSSDSKKIISDPVLDEKNENSGGSDFWTPPVGDRWDDDNGEERWGSSDGPEIEDEVTQNSSDEDEAWILSKDTAMNNAIVRTKRMSIAAVGPSSFASQKKKKKGEMVKEEN